MRPAEQAHEQLRRANPVPNPTALLAQLTEAADTQREKNPMNTVTPDSKTPTPTGRSRGWMVGLATAVVVLIFGGASIFLTTRENPFGGGSSPVEIAEAYIDARNDYDAERALELVSDDFTTSEVPDGYVDASTLEPAFQWHEIQGFQFADVICEQTNRTEHGALVTCDTEWSLHLHRVGDFPPSTTHQITLLIDNGEITRAEESGTGGPQWVSWVTFLETEHPSFLEVLISSTELDPEGLQTHAEEMPRYLDLWREWLDAQED